MKILHIAQAAGGVDRFLRMLLPRLHKHGFTQILLCSQDYKETDYKDSVEHFVQVEMGQSLSPGAVLKCVRAARAVIRQYKPDVVYCHSSLAGGFGRLACIGTGVKVIYNPHGWAFDMKGNKGKRLVYLLLERLLAHVTDRFVLISNAEKLSAVVNHIAPLRKMKVIFNGIDFGELQKGLDAGRDTRKELGIGADAYLVGMVGRISPQKAPDMFVSMAADVVKRIPSAEFIIVGDGDMRSEIVGEADKLGIGGKLHITGWVDCPARYLAAMDCAVLLSRWEGFGLVIAEYMYARKPVVATSVDAIPDLVTNDVNGLLVGPDNPEAAAAAVVRLHDDGALRDKLVENAYNKVIACYDVNRVATEHIDLMQELASASSK